VTLLHWPGYMAHCNDLQDQFLEGLLEAGITRGLVRMGGQSKSEALAVSFPNVDITLFGNQDCLKCYPANYLNEILYKIICRAGTNHATGWPGGCKFYFSFVQFLQW
jgi:hypothetical protein